MKKTDYIYSANIARVIDGDSIMAVIDLGFKIHKTEYFRLYGINAPELRGEHKKDGLLSKAALAERIEGKDVVIQTMRDRKGKYGRYLAKIWDGEVCLNDWLVEEGLAERKDY
jgi:micrococcal nuclease